MEKSNQRQNILVRIFSGRRSNLLARSAKSGLSYRVINAGYIDILTNEEFGLDASQLLKRNPFLKKDLEKIRAGNITVPNNWHMTLKLESRIAKLYLP